MASKIRSDTQFFGRRIVLGGIDVLLPAWGDVGAGEVLLKKNDANTASPLLTLEAVNATDKVVDIAGGMDILGKLNASGGQLRVPTGATLPTVGEEEGDLFWKSDSDELYVYNGSAWQLMSSSISALGSLTLNGSQVSSKSTGWVEIMGFSVNLRTLFPLFDFKLQAKTWMSGAGTGEIRLYNFTDVVQVPNALISISSSVPAILEAASASTPIDAQKEYALEFKKTSGAGAISIFVRGSMLRRI